MASTLPEIERIISAQKAAESGSDLAESIKCTATVVVEDRYKIIFSESAEGESNG